MSGLVQTFPNVPVAPGAAPIAIIATGAAKSYADWACAAAGGIAVSPPANPAAAPQLAVVVPTAK